MSEKIAESEKRMSEKIAESEKRMSEQIVESEERMTGKIAESEERMTGKITDSEKQMQMYIHKELHGSENLVLSEVDRVHVNLGNRMDKLEAQMDDLVRYYRIDRLEHASVETVLGMVNDLTKRVEVLEAKTA